MSSIFKVPQTHYTSHFERARFNLTWNFNLMMMILLCGLSVAFLINGVKTFYPTFAGVIFTITVYFWLKNALQYRIIATFYSYVGAILMIATLLMIKDELHFIDTMWAIVISLFAFFTIARIHAIIIFTSQVAALVIHIVFFINQNLRLVGQLNQKDIITMAINFILCAVLMGYIINQFLKVFKTARLESEEANQELTEQYKLIQTQNEEKTVMLKEIHHRVKNNLQVITSLLRLQSKEVTDPKSLESFKDAVNRVVAMALIHEKMYQAKNFNNIDLQAYLENLISDLVHSYAVACPIHTEIRSDVNSMDQEKLIPFALIINELVSNSLKHAFTQARSGTIKISIKEDADFIYMSYEDNGIWKQPSTEAQSSFGVEMIEILTDQLDGQYALNTTTNTIYKFELKK